MNTLDNRHKCEYGWSISVPPEWKRVTGSLDSDVLSSSRPVRFTKSGDWDTYFTWMLRSLPVDDATAKQFLDITSSDGTVDKATVAPIVNSIFPLIGDIDEVTVVTLDDGTRALETTESYFEGAVKRGYQLIFPLWFSKGTPRAFQRVCFYQSDRPFQENLNAARSAARSFRYERPYGYKI